MWEKGSLAGIFNSPFIYSGHVTGVNRQDAVYIAPGRTLNLRNPVPLHPPPLYVDEETEGEASLVLRTEPYLPPCPTGLKLG